jgi:hypothetical protein
VLSSILSLVFLTPQHACVVAPVPRLEVHLKTPWGAYKQDGYKDTEVDDQEKEVPEAGKRKSQL